MKKYLLPFLVFAASCTLALYNIGYFPKMMGDEGIYVSQAYWLVYLRQLGPYTYWYDHFPLGWAQIGLWQLLVGPIGFLGNAVLSGRVFMGVILAGTTTLIYYLTHLLTRSRLSSITASLIFITSTLTLTFGRMVLLDNLAIFWFLLSLYLLFSNPSRLSNLAFSAVTISFAILSKESLLFFLPVYLYVTYYLNRENPHKKYAILTSFTTIFFLLSLFPALSLLKGEFLPASGHVSFLEAVLFQGSRGSGTPFWQTGSHFRTMLSVWLTVDPILVFLGCISTILLPFLKIPTKHKFITLYTFFFLLFLIRGGQIYDFYIIPILPLLSISIALLLNYLTTLVRSKVFILIFIGSLLTYTAVNSLYPFTAHATQSQLEAIKHLKQLPTGTTIVANNFAYLDLVLQNTHTIHWYQKVESDQTVQNSIGSISDILVDEQFSRELEGHQLSYLEKKLNSMSVTAKFGDILSPGEIRKPYTSEHLELYGNTKAVQASKYLVTFETLDTTTLDNFRNHPPYGILISNNNFSSSTGLQNLINLLNNNVTKDTLIIVTQDDTGSNTIPWLNSTSRSFYKSDGEATLATAKKAQSLKDLGFTAAIITSTQNADGYLEPIIAAANSNLVPIIRFDQTIPTIKAAILATSKADVDSLKNAQFPGEIIELLNFKQYLEKSN